MANEDEHPGSGFAPLGLTPATPDGRTVALTRRQARELENAGREVEPAPAASPAAPIGFQATRLPEPPARPAAEFPRRSVTATPAHKPARLRRTIKRGKAVGRPPRRRPGASAPSKLLSLGAMLFAGALLVGMSVPANAFMTTAGTMPGAPAPLLAAATVERLPGQTLAVSPDVAVNSPVRDGYDVTSYAQMLALKYANSSTYIATSGAVRWPFPNQVLITDRWGDRAGGFHKGMDFAPGAGTPIYAIADGVVTTAQEDETSGYGNHVIITHTINGQKIESLYSHMISGSRAVNAGDQIKVGDFLGLVGDTGTAYGANMHFEIHVEGVPVDPFAWLQTNAVN